MKICYARLVTLAGLVTGSFNAQAQMSEQLKALHFAQDFAWAEIILANGDTVRESATLYWPEDVLVLQPSKHTLPAVLVKSFSVRQLQAASFDSKRRYDFLLMRQGYFPGNALFPIGPELQRPNKPSEGVTRVFHVCRWSRNQGRQGFQTLGFFEQLSAGPVVLLNRLALEKQTSYVYGAAVSQNVKRDGLYLVQPDGRLWFLQNPEKDIYAYFQRCAPQLREFARRNKLHFTKAHELAYLVNYANSLTAPTQP
ncbi:hypothetical protein [Hymenobacter rigui]|uniref:Uncharacterized protein n=1 Tax=Hymenobacter rigui TaxID=334424 RepID=A0A3R9MMH7_9BACT|nr:hypothetical protein [Hymenobacter rigui]RSK43883.1 hypothetical protein EI291_21270 [Hymenobacter rigui]